MTFITLEQSPLFRLQSKKKLSHILGANLRDLRKIATGPEYKAWDLKKPDGGVRKIQDPAPTLKALQKRIARLLSLIDPPEYFFCPVQGKSPFDNAVRHSGAKTVITIDIRSFFVSASEARVIWFFKTFMGCSIDVAYLLTKLVTIDGHLPTGSPSSPIISHFAYRDLWDEINSICKDAGLKLSIWIDDLSISGDTVPRDVIWEIKRVIARFGLRYHPERKTVARPARVTGVILLPDGSIALPHRHFKKVHGIRAEIDAANVRADVRSLQRLHGRLDGMLGQELQLRRIALATRTFARNVGGNHAGRLIKERRSPKLKGKLAP